LIEDKDSLVVLGKHVTLEQGTGCVHTAPGHGVEDHQVAQEYDLPVFVPVDDNGCFTDEFPLMQGMFVWDANVPIIRHLDEKGLLHLDDHVADFIPEFGLHGKHRERRQCRPGDYKEPR